MLIAAPGIAPRFADTPAVGGMTPLSLRSKELVDHLPRGVTCNLLVQLAWWSFLPLVDQRPNRKAFLFICLAAPGLRCGAWDLALWHVLDQGGLTWAPCIGSSLLQTHSIIACFPGMASYQVLPWLVLTCFQVLCPISTSLLAEQGLCLIDSSLPYPPIPHSQSQHPVSNEIV